MTVPYFISDNAPGCNGWATVKDDGEVMGCHRTKQEAINQMVAISRAEGIEPGGERDVRAPVPGADKYTTKAEALARAGQLGCEGTHTMTEDGQTIYMPCNTHAAYDNAKGGTPSGYSRTLFEVRGAGLPDNYRPATSPDVPEGRACGNCFFFNENDVAPDGRARCMKWGEYVEGGFVCNSWQAATASDDMNSDQRAPAPASDQITGSDKNEPGSAAGSGGDIEVSEATRTALENKVTEHNEAMTERDRPSWTRARIGQLLAVYRRGSGAFSTSHRPGVSRAAWSMARVNAFLYLLRTGRPQNSAYITDNDLLPEDHPRGTKRTAPEIIETRATPPNYMQAAAARGLELRREGFAGDGVTDKTVREARGIADGNISDDKIVRAFAWSQRHAVDLRAPKNNDPDHPEWPGAGAVAHYLWGINPLNPGPAIRFLERESNRLQERTTMSDLEFRVFDASVTEIRAAEDGDGMTFGGYAWKYDAPSLPLGHGFTERIAPGAFTRSLKSRVDIRAYVNHNDELLLGSTRAKTLRIDDRADGGFVEIDLPDTTWGRDIKTLVQRSDITGMSFGFSTVKDDWSDDGTERTLLGAKLHEVSVVTGVPAYPQTTASVRKLQSLASRTATDVDDLSEAMTALQAGQLSEDQANLLRTVVDQVAPHVEPEPTTPMSVLAAKLSLAEKALGL